MHHPRLLTPPFTQGSYGERAAAFFAEDQPWEPLSGRTDAEWIYRAVTWARYPNRYLLKQIAEQKRSYFNQIKLHHRLFELSLLSAKRTFDGKRNFEQWYIVQSDDFPENVMHFEQLVDEPEIEKKTGEMSKNFTFIADNGFYVPNDDDMKKLDSILELGYMDGADAL